MSVYLYGLGRCDSMMISSVQQELEEESAVLDTSPRIFQENNS